MARAEHKPLAGSYFETFDQIRIEPERFVEFGELVVVPTVAHIRGRDGIEAVARSEAGR